ncbi:hypothetical protein [Haloplanus salilacus]|uniref:hypothetical protein n=1 Tax=Haloplanus salilacus TaxID=2949994 RepID=UPI0030CC6F83
MASFETLADRASEAPVISPLPALATFYLDGLSIYRSVDTFHRDLYDPDYQFEQDVVIDDDSRYHEYPYINCTTDPITPALNDVVDWANEEHHDRIRQDLLQQSKLKNHILDAITGEDFVALIIIDGLSYDALRTVSNEILQPVIVDGITTTEPGFRRIIYGGDPASIYASLTGEGFYTGYGFTYWERGQEDLSTDLHSAMGQNIHRIRDFDEVISTLEADAPFTEKTYVQVTRMGLDQDSHNRKENPNRNVVRDEILSDVKSLAETASTMSDNFRIFMTADHGILWRDQLPEDPPIVHDEWTNHARFLTGQHNLEHGMVVKDSTDPTTGLAYPYLTRELKNTEWGVHGGFSYQESIVPLIEVTSPGDLE